MILNFLACGLRFRPFEREKHPKSQVQVVLGGSWVVIGGVISKVTIVITHIGGLKTPLVITHEPASRAGKPTVVLGQELLVNIEWSIWWFVTEQPSKARVGLC